MAVLLGTPLRLHVILKTFSYLWQLLVFHRLQIAVVLTPDVSAAAIIEFVTTVYTGTIRIYIIVMC